MKKLPIILALTFAATAAHAADSARKARMDALMAQLQEAVAAKDQPRAQRIAADLKRESEAAAQEAKVKADTEGKRPGAQAFKQRAQESANAIQAVTETLEYKIMKAAQKGDIKEVRTLRGQGADVNAIGGMVEPPLFAAARRGDIAMATYLLSEGAKVQLGEGPRARSALIAAVDVPHNRTDRSDMIRLLASKGGDVNFRFGTEYVPTGDTRKDDILREQSEKMRGDSPLIYAVRTKHVAHVRTLLALHANPNLYSMGQTPLQLARRLNNTEITNMLTTAGAH